MAQDASVRVNLRASEFELAGSEAFVERMTTVLGDLLAKQPMKAAPISADVPEDEGGRDSEVTLGTFLQAKKITKQSPHADIIDVFVFFHTKIKKNASAKAADIMTMYEDAGYPKPSNISRDLRNLTRTDGKGHLASAGYGNYKLTIAGENFVTRLSE